LPTLTLCMIVRDEQDTLSRCLDSVAGVFDEIVIVDTGSKDATKEIAARRGARVVEFEWIDDFAAARNFAFAQGSSELLMWLDADDVLLPVERDKLLALKADLNPRIDAVSMVYHTQFDPDGNVTSSNRRFRIVRRDKGFHWAGIVHEDLVSTGQFTYLDTDIVVTHRKPQVDAGPSRRNLTIFENHVRAGRTLRPADVLNYARELDMHKQFDRAIPLYQQFIDDESQDLHVRTFALHKLASCYFMAGQPDKEWECTLKSLELDTPRPEFACRVAERFLSRNQFRQAAFWYELALTIPVTGAPNLWSIESHPFQTWVPHKQLGLCYFHLGDYARSLKSNQAAQEYRPADSDIATNIRLLEDIIRETAAPGTT